MSDADRLRWNKRYASKTEPLLSGNKPDELLVRFRNLLTGGRALDLACGAGQNALWLAGHGYQVDAVDISDVAIGRLLTAADSRRLPVRAIHADLDLCRLPAATYDLIVVFSFLDRRLAPQIITALRPGGLLFYESFNMNKLKERSRVRRDFLLKRGELARLFSGLKIIWDSDAVGEDGFTSSLIAQK